MTYYFAQTLDAPFDEALARTRKALADHGFGVISEIDVQATLAAKLGVPFRRYLILGACNPQFAHEALQLEDKVGTMLPCNVVVQELPQGGVEVAAINPLTSMLAVPNAELHEVAARVGGRLRDAVHAL